MPKADIARPTLEQLREQARASGIEIPPEREPHVLAGAQYLHEAAERLRRFVAEHGASDVG